jgi:integrase
MRGKFLYDFLTGFPGRYWGKDVTPPEEERIHAGYALKPCMDLTQADVQEWLDYHPSWKNRRPPLAAVLRAVNYCWKELKLIPANPIFGIPKPSDGQRDTYFTPEIEEAIYKYGKPAMAMAVRVCIRTGARPNVEFGSLEARHVHETDYGQVWKFPALEAKGRKKARTIYVPDDIAQIVRELIKKYPTGKLFRDPKGNPWTDQSLVDNFRTLRNKLKREGISIDSGIVMYSARHTFAKRMLGGYWGKQVSLEVLAGLMGNSPAICWKHYAKWSDQYVVPMWDAVNGTPPASSSPIL